MLLHPFTSNSKKCPQYSKKLILIPLATLGIVGFFINTHISFIHSNGLCYPQLNIVFLKIHKSAGSSIQNILMRYGDTHNLNFVLPRAGNYLGHPSPFSRTMVGKPTSFSFNILAHHTRLDYDEIRKIMPRNTVYITIIRDPIEIFESSYSYYGFDKIFKGDIHQFIRYIPKFTDKLLEVRFRRKLGANQMFFDLGGDPGMFRNESRIAEYLDKLESWFHLVMVADRMDESLVLLRHLLCWGVDDVVAFKLNARNPVYKSNLSDSEKQKLRILNHADVLLHNRFLERFEAEVEAFGKDRMASEVAELNRRTRDWYELCVEGLQPHKKDRPKPKHYVNPRVMKFETRRNVTNATCRSLTMEELEFTEFIRQRQLMALPSSFKPVLPNRITIINRSRDDVRTLPPS